MCPFTFPTNSSIHNPIEFSIMILQKEDFWKSIGILIRNFSAVNKNIISLKIWKTFKILDDDDYHNKVESIVSCVSVDKAYEFIDKHKEQFIPLENVDVFNELSTESKNIFNKILLFVKVIKKRSDTALYALLVLDSICNSFTFFKPFGENGLTNFIAILEKDQIVAKPWRSDPNDEINEKELQWCRTKLQKKLNIWATSDRTTLNNKKVSSLNLIDIEEYNVMYENLKVKYGKPLVQNWPECTDPSKFVHEDIAIATYLILLWKKMRKPKGFIDLGCGNGLLVYILNSEGISGYGIDVRRRKIWDMYPSFVNLMEKTLVPSDVPAFENIDWILGNHSDELSPWISILAVLNSYKTNYFLLPCCAYEFNGDKYQRRNCKLSTYNDFLEYLEKISTEICGFRTKIDRLKIPSTKRIALVGVDRTYSENNFESEKNRIKVFLQENIENKPLKLRETKEAVRNCTQIDKTILNKIILKIFEFLLSVGNPPEEEEMAWIRGGTATIREIAEYFSSDELKHIKAECGGLKTLLKNKHEIFEVSRDQVQLRYPRRICDLPDKDRITLKKRNCFYYNHHPNGCPLSDENCSFVHEKTIDIN